MSKIKVGIIGYGNIGRGVELSISQNPDMELAAVFTRRDPDSVVTVSKNVKVLPLEKAPEMRNELDVVINCSGSATDLPKMGPKYAAIFNTVDSFDTHAKIPEYFAAVEKAAKEAGKLSMISVGWDPGLFSINRLLGESILPQGSHYTFWGRGVSQGHSDALRRISGIKNAIQYTVPVESSVQAARSGNEPNLATRQKHTRECFVVLEDSADAKKIENEIKTMPNYFSDYDTTVTFVTEEELKQNHSKMPHGGFVIRTGKTGNGENKNVIEYSLTLDSNAEFTSSVLVCYARAVARLAKEGDTGAKTVLDIPPAYLSPKSSEELRAQLL